MSCARDGCDLRPVMHDGIHPADLMRDLDLANPIAAATAVRQARAVLARLHQCTRCGAVRALEPLRGVRA